MQLDNNTYLFVFGLLFTVHCVPRAGFGGSARSSFQNEVNDSAMREGGGTPFIYAKAALP